MQDRTAPRKTFTPPEPVNLVAPGRTILPPKLPAKEDQEGRKDNLHSQTLEVRILPAFDENGKETPVLDPEKVKIYDDLPYKSDVLGDWIVKSRACSVRHYSKSQKSEYFSWLPGDCIVETGGDEPEIKESPASVCSWKWFKALKGYRERRKALFKKKVPGREIGKLLGEEYDSKSVLAVNSVSPAGFNYFLQVIPLRMGAVKYDVEALGISLLPISGPGTMNAFEQYIALRSDRFGEDEPLSLETMGIEADVVSFANGHTLKMTRDSTAYVFTPGIPYPLPDGWSEAWTPWEKVLPFCKPEQLIEPLIRLTSPAAVDWALEDTEWESLIPEKHRGCGAEFNPEPLAGTSVQVDGNKEEDDIPYGDAPQTLPQASVQPPAQPPTISEDSQLPKIPPTLQDSQAPTESTAAASTDKIEVNVSDESADAYRQAVSQMTQAHQQGVNAGK